jgi:hypothetical protein
LVGQALPEDGTRQICQIMGAAFTVTNKFERAESRGKQILSSYRSAGLVAPDRFIFRGVFVTAQIIKYRKMIELTIQGLDRVLEVTLILNIGKRAVGTIVAEGRKRLITSAIVEP